MYSVLSINTIISITAGEVEKGTYQEEDITHRCELIAIMFS